jgi:hypothetical protein
MDHGNTAAGGYPVNLPDLGENFPAKRLDIDHLVELAIRFTMGIVVPIVLTITGQAAWWMVPLASRALAPGPIWEPIGALAREWKRWRG